ncbi:MAG TPA: phage terminase small subunit P27 family [Pseudoflavonifractor sp.]|nr:phage terminase small subunit P27 family [Pseudoflavonifractor sp.]
MSAPKKSVAALRAGGSRHYSKAKLAEREAQEVKAPPVTSLDPPSYLPASLAEKFRKLAPVLIHMGVLSEVDGDCLARYLIAESNYLRVTSRLTSALNTGNLQDADKWSAMQDRFFKQCRAAGSDLGLTVSGRCRLVLPEGVTVEGEDGEGDLFGD